MDGTDRGKTDDLKVDPVGEEKWERGWNRTVRVRVSGPGPGRSDGRNRRRDDRTETGKEVGGPEVTGV